MPKPRRKTRRTTSRGTSTSKLADLIRILPGYDPYADAGDYYFDEEAAQLKVDFFPDCLCHSKGEWRGRRFILEDWQQAIIANTFGWKRPGGLRRYRTIYVEIPRKNGKTLLVAGTGNAVAFTDGEPAADVYCGAGDRDQAAIVFDAAKFQVESEPELADRARVFRRAIEIPATGSVLRVVSSEAKTKHGLNAHCVIIDELHVQERREFVETLTTSTGSRRQPLVIYITTAGYDTTTICYEMHCYAEKVRDGIIKDPSFLPVIYAAGKEDDWTDPKVWAKANPNLGVSIKPEYIEQKCREAKESPLFENTFKRLHLNIWTEQETRWLRMSKWHACNGAVDLEKLKGRQCYGAIDLSTKLDFTAFGLTFPPTSDDLLYRFACWFWIPDATAAERERRDKVPVRAWAADETTGLTLTPGEVIDYNYIEQKVLELAAQYDVTDIAFDQWHAQQTANNLAAQGLEMVEYRQTFQSMSEPTMELEKLIISGAIAHGGNPVLDWMASNVVALMNPSGEVKLAKEKNSKARIDGIICMVMGIGRHIVNGDTGGSVYEKHGLTFV